MEHNGGATAAATEEAVHALVVRTAACDGEASRQAAEQLLDLAQGSPLLVQSALKPLQHLLMKAMASGDEELVNSSGAVLAAISSTRAPQGMSVREVALPGLFVKIRELEAFDGDNFGAQIWTAAVWLSHCLCACKGGGELTLPAVNGKRVLELGAGCGLCGIVSGELGATEVVITDCVTRLNDNIQYNIELQEGDHVSQRCCAAHLDWADPSHCRGLHRSGEGNSGRDSSRRPSDYGRDVDIQGFDLIIGADLLLNTYSAVTLLPAVIKTALAPHGSCAMCFAIRCTKTLGEFLKALEAADLKCQVEDQTDCLPDEVAAYDGWDSIRKYEGGLALLLIQHCSE